MHTSGHTMWAICNRRKKWFSTLDLIIGLKQQGLCVTVPFRTNRLGGCPLLCDKELKKHGRGSCSYRIDANSGLLLLKWYDNKAGVSGLDICISKNRETC